MKDTLIKAYKAAWRWPEVYSHSPSTIWVSRVIAVALPLVLVGLAFFLFLPVLGILVSALIGVVTGIVMVIATVVIFFKEFEGIESFKLQEAQVREFFHGFPSITNVPVIEHGEGEWIAYGHLPSEDFVDAIRAVVLEVTEDPCRASMYTGAEEYVEYLYAAFLNPEEGHWKEGISFCKPSVPTSFPITRLDYPTS